MINERIVIKAKELSKEDLYFLEQDKKKIQDLRVKAIKESDEAYRQAHQSHCFRCGTPSLIEIDHGTVKLDMCVNAECGAVHLDPGEMEKILEGDKSLFFRVKLALASAFK